MSVRAKGASPAFYPVVFVGLALIMAVFEFSKGLVIGEGMSLWQSHLITIVFAAAAGTAIFAAVLARQARHSAEVSAAESRADTFRKGLLDAVPVAIFYKDREGRYLGCNKVFAEIMGVGEDDIRGKTVTELWPSELAATYHQKDIDLMAEPTLQQYEYQIVDKEGRTHDVIYSKAVIRDEHGMVAGIVGAFLDISERKRAEQEMEAAQRLVDSIVENIPHMIFLKRAEDLRFVRLNKAGENLLGVSRQELFNRNDYDFFPVEQADFFAAKDREVLAARGIVDVKEEAIDTRNHGRRLLHTRKLALVNAQGQPEYLLGISEDITDKKRDEEELDRHRHHLEAEVAKRTEALETALKDLSDTQFAMDKVGIGITWADFETARILYANSYTAGFLGYGLDEILQLTVCDIDPNFPFEAFVKVREDIKAQGYVQFETEQLTKDGRLVPVEMTIYYDAGHGPGHERLIAFMSDIARRKRAEQELVKAKEAADFANAAKSEFLANMSHEIRTPLNAILGLSFLLRSELASGPSTEKLEKIEIAGRHLLSLINDILDISKIEAGGLVLDNANFHLSAVLDNVASIVRDSATTKGVALVVDADSVPEWLWGDVTRLRQALLNYASNAVKFTAKGSVAIRARLLNDHEGDLRIRFEVTDTGIGLTEAQMHRLFQPFQQADGSTSRKFGGTGLGLALTRRLVELMDGRVGVESTPGAGSTFWFEVRVERGHGPMPVEREAEPAAESEVELRARHAGARVLLADDNEINVEVVGQLLHAAGMDVAVATNGREAVELGRKEVFALVLMDMQMPELNGVEATRQLRGLPGWSQVPILALTANAFAEDRRSCLEAGMNETLTKPIEPDALYAALLHWLSGAPSVPPAPAAAKVATTGTDGDPVLAGVNLRAGLTITRGRPERYLELVETTVNAAQIRLRECRSRIAEGDAPGARNEAHGIKGSAAMLGLEALAAAAASVENLLRDTDGLLQHGEALAQGLMTIGDVAAGLGASMGTLRAAVAADPSAKSNREHDPQIVLAKLERLLASYDMESLDFLKVNAESLHPMLGDDWNVLKRHVADFDFEPALDLLRRR